MPSTSGKMHRAMAAAAAGHSTLGIPQSVGKEFLQADKGKHFSRGGLVTSCYKGGGPVVAEYAVGGPALQTSRSRFMKEPDPFRTDIERQDYSKRSPAGELGKLQGETKVKTPVKPQG